MNYVDFLYNWVENLDYSLKKLKDVYKRQGYMYRDTVVRHSMVKVAN